MQRSMASGQERRGRTCKSSGVVHGRIRISGSKNTPHIGYVVSLQVSVEGQRSPTSHHMGLSDGSKRDVEVLMWFDLWSAAIIRGFNSTTPSHPVGRTRRYLRYMICLTHAIRVAYGRHGSKIPPSVQLRQSVVGTRNLKFNPFTWFLRGSF